MKNSFIISFFLLISTVVFSQDSEASYLPDNTTRREEIQRYAGYEDLPLLYLTLVYDAVMGTNISVSFMDIGFLLLLIIPLFLLWNQQEKIAISRILFFIFLGFFIFILFPSGFLNYHKISSDQVQEFILQNPVEGSQPPALVTNLLRDLMVFILPSFVKFETWLRQSQPSYGVITYPILIGLFFSLLLAGYYTLKDKSDAVKFFSITLYFYIFLWIMVSSGISWYGIVALPLGLIFINLKREKWVLAIILLQLLIHFPYRISRYENANPTKGQMYESAASAWITGQIDETKYVELLTEIPQKLLDYLNQDKDSKIYKVGTNLHFFINENDRRVFQDNQLGHFRLLHNSGNTKEGIASTLKNDGYRFFIADLSIQNMDQTPERSLEKKHRHLLDFLHDNSNLRLLFTDRIILDEATRIGKPGIGNESDKIIKKGKLAIFQIL
jgi:hypothetical protein